MNGSARFRQWRAPRVRKGGRALEDIGPRKDSWGGVAAVLFLVSALGYPVVGRLVDGAHLVYDSLGRASILVEGKANTAFGVGLFAAAVGASAIAAWVARRSRHGSAASFLLQILVLWWAVLSVLIPRKEGLGAADLVIVGAIPLVIGMVTAPPTLTTARRINLVRDVFATAQFVYPFLSPQTASLPCREDKCGIFGGMHTGFYTQENSGIAAISLLLPLAATSSPKRLAYSSIVAILVALASGSRTGLVSVLLATLLAVYIRHRFLHGARQARLPLVLLLAPAVATGISLALFLFADPTALTGRGAVYAANLNALQGPALWYGVPWNTVEVASNGYLISDHGQTSHIFARSGLVGFLLWALAILMPLRRRRYGLEETIGLAILSAGAARMLTESTFELEARSSGFLALLLVAGYLATPARGLVRPDWPAPRVLKAYAATALLTVVVVVAVPWLMPRAYQASTVVAVTAPAFDSASAEETWRGRRQAAASAEALVRRPSLVRVVTTSAGMGDPGEQTYAVVAARPIEATFMRLTTTGPDERTTADVNDAVARYLGDQLQHETTGFSVQVRPLGPSAAQSLSPWLTHLEVTLLMAGLGVAAFLLVGRRWGEPTPGPPRSAAGMASAEPEPAQPHRARRDASNVGPTRDRLA